MTEPGSYLISDQERSSTHHCTCGHTLHDHHLYARGVGPDWTCDLCSCTKLEST